MPNLVKRRVEKLVRVVHEKRSRRRDERFEEGSIGKKDEMDSREGMQSFHRRLEFEKCTSLRSIDRSVRCSLLASLRR